MGVLLLLFIVIPILEIYVLMNVGGQIGVLNTFAIVIVTAIVGASMAKREGRSVLIRIQKSLSEGREPTDDMIQGVMVLIGGVLLLTPGFVTDAFGLSLIFPLTRLFYLKAMKSHFKNMVAKGQVHFYTNMGGQRQTQSRESQSRQPQNPDVIDVDSERLD